MQLQQQQQQQYFSLNEENIVRWIPNLRATTAVFQLTADKHGNKRTR
jgi:hypothetical protein